MSVISRLLRQAPPPAATVEQPSPDAVALSASELTHLAVGDPAASPEQQRAAQLRLAGLLDSGTLRLVDLGAAGEPATLLAIVGMCRNDAVVEQAIADITDESQLGELALRGASPAIRRLAAGKVNSPTMLGRLLKDAQGKDKHVYRILKTKRDAIHTAERATAEAVAALHTLCGTIERHGRQPYSETYASTVEFLGSQWQAAAEHAPQELAAQANAALARCREVIARHGHQVAEAANRTAQLAAAVAARSALLNAARTLLGDVYAATAQDVTATLAAHRTEWRENAAIRAPGSTEQAEFERLGHAIESLAEFNAQHGSITALTSAVNEGHAALLRDALRHLPLLGDAVPQSAAAAQGALQAWEAACAAEQDAAANSQRQIVALLRKAQGALAGGNSRQAAGIRRALEDRLQSLPALAAAVTGQLQAFDAKLALLQDWRSYAVAPKRTELIAQMEALIGSTDQPQTLAERIHKLQAEWKLISKGNTEDTSAEWERFHTAAQQAYEPCKAYFAAQAQQRATNLERRAALLERLAAFVTAQDWEQPDWREVARAVRESQQQWRAHQPVERAANKSLQERFDTLTTDLQSRLDAEYERNSATKRQLIAQAQQLVTADDAHQAAEGIKRLQASWKEIGLTPQHLSQPLWDEFRQHCDAVFARRQQRYSEQAAQLNASQAAAAALCDEAEGLSALGGPALVEAMKRLPALRESFDALGELPRDAARALRNRLERALEKCERQLARQRAEAQLVAWDRVMEAGDCIRRYRLALIGSRADEACAELRQAAEALLAGDTPWPKGTLQPLKAALAAAGSTDSSSNETSLRTLCIRAELLTGAPTPETDLAFRRNYQLQQLTKGLGQARESGRDALQALLIEWIGVGPTSDAAYAVFTARLARCRELAAAR
jgi:DNA repair protein SbcC/Rad50